MYLLAIGICPHHTSQPKDTAKKTASRFFHNWVVIFGALASIIGDRNKTLTLKFWKELMKESSTDLHLLTVFHPQADGRSKRSNKTIGQILRTFTSKRQLRWLEALPFVEHSINSMINVATGLSPLKPIFGRNPNFFPAPNNTTNLPPLAKWLCVRKKVWADARNMLWTNRVKQAVQQKRQCQDRTPLREGNWALLNNADWRGRHQGVTDKLKERYEGPYRIIQVFNAGQNITLELPSSNKRHPNFHVSKVKVFVETDDVARLGDTKVSSSQYAPLSVDMLSF